MSKIGERCLRTRAVSARRSWQAISTAPLGASARTASRQTSSGSRTCSIVCIQLMSVNDSSARTPALNGSGRINARRVAGAAASGAAEGSKPTVSSNPAARSRSRNAPSPAPMSAAPRRSGSVRAIVSRTSPYVAAAYLRLLAARVLQPRDTRRSGTRTWGRGSRRAGRTTRTRGGGGRAPPVPSATRTTSSRARDCSNRASTNTRASVDPHTGHGRPSCSNLITVPGGGRPAARAGARGRRPHARAVT